MPNIGAPEILMLLLLLAIPAGIGYWCSRLWRRKGRSPAVGFVLGFFVTIFGGYLIGGAVIVIISYVMGEKLQIAAAKQARAPEAPRPPAPVAPLPPE